MLAQTPKPTTTSTITLIPTVSTLQSTIVSNEKIIIKNEQKTKPAEGKQRIMPSHHVEYLLEIYSEYLNKRMLESGRLSKGEWIAIIILK